MIIFYKSIENFLLDEKKDCRFNDWVYQSQSDSLIIKASSTLNDQEMSNYNCGPAFTNAFPAAFPSYLAKFLMKRPARSLAFSSHSEAFA